MWRGAINARSRITAASPNAPSASLCALRKASPKSVAASTLRMPRPPPPDVALIITGQPIAAASRASRSVD